MILITRSSLNEQASQFLKTVRPETYVLKRG